MKRNIQNITEFISERRLLVGIVLVLLLVGKVKLPGLIMT